MSSDFAKDTVYTIIVYTIIVDLKPSDLASGLGNSMCKSEVRGIMKFAKSI